MASALRWALCVAILTTVLPARAADDTCTPDDGFSTCLASDNLWPQPGGGRFVTQAPTQLPTTIAGSFGVVPTYYLRPIGFEVASPDPDGTTVYAVEHVLAAHFLTALNPLPRLQLQLSVPAILYQNGAGKTDVVGAAEGLSASAVGDVRFGARVGILRRGPQEDGPGLSGRFEMTAPSSDPGGFAGYPSATWAPGLSFDYRLGRLHLGTDLGGRFRDHVQLGGAVVGSQLTASLGVSVDILDDGWLSAAAEVWALFTLMQQYEIAAEPGGLDSDVEAAPPHIPTEWLLSLRTAALLDGSLRVQLGGGGLVPTGPHTAVTSPAFRGVLGVHYVHDLLGDAERSAGSSAELAQKAR